MRVGLLIVSHSDIGKTILETAVSIIGSCPLDTDVLTVPMACVRDDILATAREKIQQLDHGDGVLVLTDMYGATPCNISCDLEQKNTAIVAGLNLPMLIRVLNYPQLSLTEMVDKALTGGQDGVIACHRDSYK